PLGKHFLFRWHPWHHLQISRFRAVLPWIANSASGHPAAQRIHSPLYIHPCPPDLHLGLPPLGVWHKALQKHRRYISKRLTPVQYACIPQRQYSYGVYPLLSKAVSLRVLLLCSVSP